MVSYALFLVFATVVLLAGAIDALLHIRRRRRYKLKIKEYPNVSKLENQLRQHQLGRAE